MKSTNRHVFPLILATAALITAAEAADPAMPRAISEFYEAWNFASSFSTPKERKHLISVSPHFSAEATKFDRLKEVDERMRRVQSQIRHADPGINFPGKDEADFPDRLIDVEDARIAADSALVKVKSYPVTSEDNLLFVSTYERVDGREGRLPSISERLSILRIPTPTTEIHRWRKVGDNWMKEEAHVVLTD